MINKTLFRYLDQEKGGRFFRFSLLPSKNSTVSFHLFTCKYARDDYVMLGFAGVQWLCLKRLSVALFDMEERHEDKF